MPPWPVLLAVFLIAWLVVAFPAGVLTGWWLRRIDAGAAHGRSGAGGGGRNGRARARDRPLDRVAALKRHTHTWHVHTHLDGCHSSETIYVCRCGRQRSVGQERDIESDPYSVIWLLDRDCERCKDLLAGAKPRSWARTLA